MTRKTKEGIGLVILMLYGVAILAACIYFLWKSYGAWGVLGLVGGIVSVILLSLAIAWTFD